ncbi:hypothetical protein M3484_20810 [Pseudomonas sp. GX19020]|uniref:hypothetical protein n=1 Tax=Pseudomonas sp. GX19020 TaxID=2942277 RepID=UPI00201A1736|nr:hypothetical protein [Pseudomonas sp. GX19020]MCL4069002.1 hypothetical protein [Pseudomonas sp. GX19020]
MNFGVVISYHRACIPQGDRGGVMAQQGCDHCALILQSEIAAIDAVQAIIDLTAEMRLDFAKRIEIADEAMRPASDRDLTTEGVAHDQAATTFAVGAEVAEVEPVPLVAVTITRNGLPT